MNFASIVAPFFLPGMQEQMRSDIAYEERLVRFTCIGVEAERVWPLVRGYQEFYKYSYERSAARMPALHEIIEHVWDRFMYHYGNGLEIDEALAKIEERLRG